MTSRSHHDYMRHALRLARRNLGQTWPNPSVGCVLVMNDQVISATVTAPGGRPHAEPQAITHAGGMTRGATLYVTLEPCAHQGATPPCIDTIIDAGIAHVVVACEDPDPRVAGGGIAALRRAGIHVTTGICETEALTLNTGFFSRLTRNRPLVSLKIATSLDGKVATAKGESKWLTGEEARAYGQMLRGTHDAILTGINTVLADDPLLTCRTPGLEHHSPIRIVLDSNLQMPAESALIETAQEYPVWVFTLPASLLKHKHKVSVLERAGAIITPISALDGRVNIQEVLHHLAGKGITRLLVEAGGKVSTRFLQEKLIDQLYWFRAPLLLGENGHAAFLKLPFNHLYECPRLSQQEAISLGSDRLEIYKLE